MKGITMDDWLAEFTNNPDDDYNLIIEISNNDESIGRIYKINNELIFQMYETDKKTDIPMDWLYSIFEKAKKDL
jgi:hypothetical protein